MVSAILASVLFVGGSVTNRAAAYPAEAARLDGRGTIVNLIAATRAERESCGWFALEDNPPRREGYYAIPTGYERTADGYRRVYRLEPIPPPPPREIFKYDIMTACGEADKLAALVGFVNSDPIVLFAWNAAEILREDDANFIAATNAVVASGVATDAEVKAIIERAVELGGENGITEGN